MKLVKKTLSCFLFLITINQAHSQILRIRVTDYGWLDSLPVLKPVLDNYLEGIQTDINNDQPIKNPQRLIKGTANSTALASRGIGTDYTSQMEKFMMGVSLGVAVDAEKNVALKDEISGIGGAAGFLLGLKLDERLNVYANIGGVSHSRVFPGIEESELEAEVTTFNVGTHLRYDLIKGSGDNWFGWGGVKVNFGYEYNQNEFDFVDPLNEELELDTGVAVIQGRLKGRPKYKIQSETHSFPLEVSSDVSFLKIFTLYGGAGADYNFGKAKGTGDVRATVKSPLVCALVFCTNLNLPEIEVQGYLNAKQKVDSVFFRGFAGLQIQLWRFLIYGQVEQVMGSKLIGASTGVRAVF